jgi:hypothetical protein
MMPALSYYWHLPILIVVISLVCSATRFERWPRILVESLRWGLWTGGILVGVSVVFYVLQLFI